MFDDSLIIIPKISEAPRFPVYPMRKDQWKNGLLVRTPNWLGDAVMTLPALRQLKQLLPPPCGLLVVCPAGIQALFKAMPSVVDEIIPLQNAHAFPSKKEWMKMKDFHPGAGILFNNSFRDALAIRSTGISKLFGAAARGRSALLSASFVFPKRKDFELNEPHHAARYLAMAYAIGAKEWDGIMPELVSRPFSAETMPPSASALFNSPRKIMLIAGGAAYGDAKRYPAESFRAIAQWWINSMDGTVVSVGSKAEFQGAAEIVRDLPESRALNLAGATSMEQLIVLVKQAAVCVANDSGVMHLAAAAGCGGLALFGPTDPVATSPISSNWRILFEKRSCSPCFKRECPKGTKECFQNLRPEIAIELLRKMMK